MIHSKKELYCAICGRQSPNPYGECGCSYDLEFFQNERDCKLIRKIGMAMTYRQFLKLKSYDPKT